MKDNSLVIQKAIASSPKEIDLTSDQQSEALIRTVETILDEIDDLTELESIESNLIDRNDPSFIFVLLALKIAKSKLLTTTVKEPLRVSVVFAVYKEHNRIRTNREHPHGENFLLRKVEQLKWLFSETPHVNWELVVVDDGCPEGSGKIAEQIIEENNISGSARVLFLSDAIEKGYEPARNLGSTNDSQKGGSIVYGMWDVVQRTSATEQIVVYTDADLSTHLGQLMLLIDPILNLDHEVAIGSRRERQSVVIKKGARNERGKLFIYLWKRLIPNLGHIVDTQCGFKALDASIVPEVITGLVESKFAFDIELLLKAELHRTGSVTKVPIAWIDSEEASTTTDLQPYLPMLKAIVKMNRKYFPEHTGSGEFAEFIESLDHEGFDVVLNNIPAAILQKEPSEFAKFDEVRALDLRTGN